MVLASSPVASARRRLARPVGAASSHRSFLTFASRIRSFTIVVFPVPGPPVMTVTPPVSAVSTARGERTEQAAERLFLRVRTAGDQLGARCVRGREETQVSG